MIFDSRKAGSMKFYRVWKKRNQLRSHLPHPSPQRKHRFPRSRTWGGKPRRWRRNASGGSELAGPICSALPTHLPEAGRPLHAGLLCRGPSLWATPSAEWGRLGARLAVAGRLTTSFTWVLATACWGLHGPWSDHLPSCLSCTTWPHPGLRV